MSFGGACEVSRGGLVWSNRSGESRHAGPTKQVSMARRTLIGPASRGEDRLSDTGFLS